MFHEQARTQPDVHGAVGSG